MFSKWCFSIAVLVYFLASFHSTISESTFTCTNGKLTIPQSQVNDDFCDCPDASDEPLTSACPHGQFRCVNKGFLPKTIPSSRVKDGFCDCCDASDERGTGKCSNICLKLSEDAKERAKKLNEIEMETHLGKTKWQMINESQTIKNSKIEMIKSLEIERLALMSKVEEARISKETIEKRMGRDGRSSETKNRHLRKQSNIVFKYLDANDDGKLQFEEFKDQEFFDSNRDGTVTDEERNHFTYGNELITQEFFLEYVWPRLKPVIKSFDSIASAEFTKLQQRLEKESDKHKEFIDDDDDEEDLEHHYSYGWIPKGLGDEYNLVSWQYSVTNQKLEEVEERIKEAKMFLKKDHGPDNEFASLDGECFFHYDIQFTYKLCHYEKVIKMKTGSIEKTHLGTWKGWLAQDGDDHKVMLYDDGHKCRQGLLRSTKVIMVCGPSNKIVAFRETAYCQALIEFQTPVSCRKLFHDEL